MQNGEKVPCFCKNLIYFYGKIKKRAMRLFFNYITELQYSHCPACPAAPQRGQLTNICGAEVLEADPSPQSNSIPRSASMFLNNSKVFFTSLNESLVFIAISLIEVIFSSKISGAYFLKRFAAFLYENFTTIISKPKRTNIIGKIIHSKRQKRNPAPTNEVKPKTQPVLTKLFLCA